jgi:hypothetical protein
MAKKASAAVEAVDVDTSGKPGGLGTTKASS